VIFDTNVLIYLSKYALKPERILDQATAISIITKIEVLGFPFKNSEEHDLLLAICNELKIVALTDLIAEETINLRQHYRIKLPDAIIYATALVENVPLLTNNFKDFQPIHGRVRLINPFDL
jgi:predicted nucleic acid-binding protein